METVNAILTVAGVAIVSPYLLRAAHRAAQLVTVDTRRRRHRHTAVETR
jgi:hypothetical protein